MHHNHGPLSWRIYQRIILYFLRYKLHIGEKYKPLHLSTAISYTGGTYYDYDDDDNDDDDDDDDSHRAEGGEAPDEAKAGMIEDVSLGVWPEAVAGLEDMLD